MPYPERSASNAVEGEAAQEPAPAEEGRPMVQDPLPGMNERDRYGLKGLFGTLKGPFADQGALVTGVDVTTLGLDLNTTE